MLKEKNMNYHQSVMNFFIDHEIHERTRKDEIHENFTTTDNTGEHGRQTCGLAIKERE